MINQWYTLRAGKGNKGDVQGEIRVKIEFVYSNIQEEGKPSAKFFKMFPQVPFSERIIHGR